MEKLYNKIDFVNNTTPALNATNLNRMSKGLDDLDNRVIDLAADIMEVGPAAEAAMEAAGTAAEAAETASGASETATGAATSAEGYASDAKNWAVGPSGSGTGTDTNNAKYWAEQAAGAVSGVSSFNGRTGVVLPQNGDYTASDVGAIASTDKGSNGGVAELDNSGKVPVSQLPAMGGASSGATGTAGLVPAPAIGDESKVLSGAGVWVPQSSGGAAISCIGYEETGSTCSNPNGYQIGDNFYKDGKFCTAIATINQGATFTENTNYVKGTIADAIKSLNSGLSYKYLDVYTTNVSTTHDLPSDFEEIVIFFTQDPNYGTHTRATKIEIDTIINTRLQNGVYNQYIMAMNAKYAFQISKVNNVYKLTAMAAEGDTWAGSKKAYVFYR